MLNKNTNQILYFSECLSQIEFSCVNVSNEKNLRTTQLDVLHFFYLINVYIWFMGSSYDLIR
jgi:hypothetical protein